MHGEVANNPEGLGKVFTRLKHHPELNEKAIRAAVESLSIELVLTEHPTEITRRTLIHMLVEVNSGRSVYTRYSGVGVGAVDGRMYPRAARVGGRWRKKIRSLIAG